MKGFTAVRDPYKDVRDIYRRECEQLANAPRKQIHFDVRKDMRKLTPLEMVLFYNEAEKMLASSSYLVYAFAQRALHILGSGGHPSQLEQLTAYLKGRLEDESSSHYIEFSRKRWLFPSSASLDEVYEFGVYHRELKTDALLELVVNDGIPQDFTLSHFSDPLWGYSFSQDPSRRLFPENSSQSKPPCNSSGGVPGDESSDDHYDDSYDDDDYDDERENDRLFPLVVDRLAFQVFADRVKPYMRFDYENV